MIANSSHVDDMSKSDLNHLDNYHLETKEVVGASIFGTALSIISTIIGGGIISIPYALTAPGFKTGTLINFSAVIIMMFCGHLYLRARDIYKL